MNCDGVIPATGHRTLGRQTEIPLGSILHDDAHEQQAIVITSLPEYGDMAVRMYRAVIFDLSTGERDVSNESQVMLYANSGTPKAKSWHIAERYTLGMDIETPPPNVPTCDWRARMLNVDERCGCGCGNTTVGCGCSFCGDCPNPVTFAGLDCSRCQDHGTCSCSCGCEDTTNESGDDCGFCEANGLCENCNETHDIHADDICFSCYSIAREEAERERIEAQEEEARQEREAATADA